jgi:hypothetical protein
MTSRLQNRRDTAANWTSNNPTLAAGEIGYETDTGKLKIGNGSTAWTSLGYTQNGTVTSITAGTGLSGGTITSTGTIAIDSTVVTLSGGQTLTNKTLTTPVISSITNTGTLTLPTSTDTLVGRATTDTLSNKILLAPEERTTVSATAATGTINFDAVTQGVLYYTSNASGNWTFNVRGNSGTTLNSILAVGDAITVAFLVQQGGTAYYATAFQVDGSAITPKWQTGTAPTGGNASSIDVYVYTIIKTAATPTYTVFASQTKFA